MAEGDIVVNRFNLYLKSAQRTSGTNSSPVFALTRQLFLTNPMNIFELTVKQVSIPYSYHNMSTALGYTSAGVPGKLQFNQLQFVVCIGGASYPSTTFVGGGGTFAVPVTLNILPGNYSITSLCTQVIYQLVNYLNYFVAGYITFTASMFSFSYSRDTMKVNFQFISSGGYVITFYFLPSIVVDGGLAYNFGITSQIDFGTNGAGSSEPVTFPAYVYEPVYGAFSTQNINCAPITSLMIRSDYLKQNRSVEFVAITDDLSDILLQVPIQTIGTTFITYDNATSVTNRLKNGVIDQVSLYLTDDRTYDVLDLNGLDWSVMMEIAEIETYSTRDNKAHQMMKQVDMSKGIVDSIQES